MQSKLTSIKNIIWAIFIAVGLLAVVVGLLFTVFTRYYGGDAEATLDLGGLSASDGDKQAEPTIVSSGGVLLTPPQTSDAGQAYIDGLTFLCDSSMIGLRDYGILTDGLQTKQVWGSRAGNLPLSSVTESKILYPADGTEITIAEAAAAAQPSRLVISLGSDGLAAVSEESFLTAMRAVLESVKTASPNTQIIFLSIPSITRSYSGTDGLTVSLIGNANDWLKRSCTELGVYYADLADMLGDGSGGLKSDYASSNGKTLNSAGLNKVLEYLRTHALS